MGWGKHIGDDDTKVVQMRLESSYLNHSYYFTKAQTKHVGQIIKSLTQLFVKSTWLHNFQACMSQTHDNSDTRMDQESPGSEQ